MTPKAKIALMVSLLGTTVASAALADSATQSETNAQTASTAPADSATQTETNAQATQSLPTSNFSAAIDWILSFIVSVPTN